MSNQFPIAVIVFFIFYHLEYLVAQNSLTSETNERNYSSSFTCENGNDIDFIDVCDGVSNCEDGTDEKGCENEAILFFYVRHQVLKLPNQNCERNYKNCLQSYDGYCDYHRFNDYGGSYCTDNSLSYDTVNLTGIYLSNNNNDLFNVQIYKSMVNYDAWRIDFYGSQMSRIKITSNGPQLDMFYIKDKNWWRQTTTRHGLWSRTKMIKENVTSPVIDWVTSNVYYISESRIKVCDQNLVICTSLQSAVIKNPILLTISSKQRLLFWIERKSTSLCYLFAYSLDKNSLSSPVRKDLKNPKWITIDSIQDRLYWLDGDNDNALKLFSSTFEGKNVKAKITLPDGTPILHNMTFAVFDSIMYWPSRDQKEIMKCSVNNCELSTTIFLPVIVDTASDYYIYSRSELGYFNMIHRSLNSNKTIDACNVSLCSHLCLPESETEYQCYCQHSEKPLPSSNTSSGFCEDDTVIAVYKDNLYIVGLFDDNSSSPIIHKYKVNISSIAAVAYDSRKGNIIFTEKDQQKIYFWVPQSRQQILILDEGPGTINLLEFDNYANNLYWIDSRVWVIKAMNLDTQIKVNVLKGNSSYVPIQFTLIPSTGYMAVLFLKTNSSVTIEKISMDGRPYSRKVLFVDDENNDVENLSLYYMKETRSIFLLNRLTNEIRYLSDKDSEFRYLKNTNIVGRIESMAFLKSAIIWSENSPVIRKTKINFLDFEMNSLLAQEIPIDDNSTGFDTMGNSVMKLLGIERQIVEPRFAKCLQNNGGCEKLCLVSRKYSKFTCSCPEGEELISDTSCRKIMVERPKQLQGETDTAKATSNASVGTKLITGSYRDPSQAIKHTSEKIENEFKNSTQNQDHNKTEITCLNSSHADLTIKELPSTNCCSCAGSISYQDSSPVCAECQPSSSLVIHFFYSVLIATVAILAFVAGYIFQGKARPGNECIRFGPENRLLEMSNINAESTVSLQN